MTAHDDTAPQDAVREAAYAYGARCHLWGEDSCSALGALAELETAIAAVRAEERKKCAADYLEKMSQDPESAVAAQMARAAAIAECEKAVIDASSKAPPGTRHTTLTHIVAALRGLGTP